MEKGHTICTWNVRSLYRSGALTAAARELARYKLELEGVQGVRWDKGGTARAGDYFFFHGKEKKNHQLGTEFFVHQKIDQKLREKSLFMIECHIQGVTGGTDQISGGCSLC